MKLKVVCRKAYNYVQYDLKQIAFPSSLPDPAHIKKGGMETLRPALQRVYMTRASSCKDALKSFIRGYQEGIQQVMSGKDDPNFQQPEEPPKKPD
ncbi:hypothetical protein MKX01_004685 [Papaver californicum]|nr:hypothetical protein MKX01_004685 [Papaver californicum]